MNAPLTPRIEKFINERLRRGSYKSATAVIEDTCDAHAECENLLSIHAGLDHADAQIAEGNYTCYDENTVQALADRVKARGQARLAEQRKTGVQ